MKYLKKAGIVVCVMSLNVISSAIADSNVNVNNNTTCNATQQTDPRVPPEGTYNIQRSDGSGEQIYTTGEKKPYIVDNGCNNNNVAPVQPYAFVTPPRR